MPNKYSQSPPTPNGRAASLGANAASKASPINVEFVLHALRQWWMIATPIGLLLAAIAGAVVFVMFEPMYEARRLFWIDEQDPYLVFQDQQGRANSQNFVKNQVGLMRSSLVLGPVVSQPEIAAIPELQTQLDPVKALADLVNISAAAGSELYHIKCSLSSPQHAATIVDAVAESYEAVLQRHNGTIDKELLDKLADEQLKSEQLVKSLRDNVRSMTIDQTGRDPYAANTAGDTPGLHPLADLNKQMADNEQEISVLQARIQFLTERMEQPAAAEIPEGQLDQAVEQYEHIQSLKLGVADKASRCKTILSKSPKGANDPTYLELQRQIERDEKLLGELREELRDRMREDLKQYVANQGLVQLDELNSQLTEVNIRQQVVEKLRNDELERMKRFTGETLELDFAREELARAQEVLDGIARRAFVIRTEQRAPKRVRLLEDKAAIPKVPVETLPYKQLVAAGGGAFIIPFALAFLWELKSRRVTSAAMLQRQGDLSVLGEIARLPARVRNSNAAASSRVPSTHRLFEESVDHVRTALMVSPDVERAQVVAITSAESGEGKTTLATQLAISLAKSGGGRTLLIDGDLRSPDVHRIFEVDSRPGLVQVLTGECSLKEAAVATFCDGLDVLPAGAGTTNPSKLLCNGELRALLNKARGEYRHVIIDTPPVLAAAESLFLSQSADAVIVCVMQGSTRLDQYQKTKRRLADARVNVIGDVLSGISLKQYKSVYGSYEYSNWSDADVLLSDNSITT